ncbi:MAG: hypothetical protein JO189_10545 [Deltaproteobacteria bacterium]|nr:hypothetical protein [Deltaproteobacteria bacterium]
MKSRHRRLINDFHNKSHSRRPFDDRQTALADQSALNAQAELTVITIDVDQANVMFSPRVVFEYLRSFA